MLPDNKIAIVFFSKDGNTKTGARIISERLNGNRIELKEVKKGNAIQALFKKGSQLFGNPWNEIIEAEVVYLMLPIWASNGVPAMNTFLEKADFKGKKVTIITFQQYSDLRNSDKVHKHISEIVTKKGGIIQKCHAMVGAKMGTFSGEDNIMKQINKIQL